MSNQFIELVRKATKLKWCMTPYCTTCGSQDYQQALMKIGGKLGGPLADELSSLDLKEITRVPGWRNALVIALIDIPLQREVVLNAWIGKAQDSDIEFLDLVLYKIVRYLPADDMARNQWVSYCANLAIKTRNLSLVESLVFVLKNEILSMPDFLKVSSELAKSSEKIQKALQISCTLPGVS